MATFAFSPNGTQYVKAEMAQISLEFDVNSKIQIYDFNYTDQKLKEEAVFSVSFTSCDWGLNDDIVAGTDQGKVLISKVNSLKTTEFKDICANAITVVKYSPSEDNNIAVGSKTGQFIILDQQGNILSAATSKTGSPHNAPIKSIKWSNIVTKVCCSVDETGKMIVWNTKQGGAVASFNINGEGIDCCFSNTVATIVFILVKGELAVIDLRQKDGIITKIPMKPTACAINFAEGVNGILSVFHNDGLVDSYDTLEVINTKQLTLVGSQMLGQQASYFYPNIWGCLDSENPHLPINLQVCAQIINNKPLLFDKRILDGTIGNNDDDQIQIINKPMCCSSLNVFRYINQGVLLQQQIIDSEELVEQVKTVINGNDRTLDLEAKEFFEHIKLSPADLLNQLIGQQEQSISDQNTGADFFDTPGSKLNSPGTTEKTSLHDANEIETHLLNGRIGTTLDILSRLGDYTNVFYILLMLKNIPLQADKYLAKYNNILNKQHDPTNEELQQNCLIGNANNINFPKLLMQISERNFSIEQSRDWRSYLQLIRAYKPDTLQHAACEVIQYIQQSILPSVQGNDRKDILLDLMRLKLLIGSKQEALQVAQLRQGQLNVKQKLSCAIMAREYGLSYLHEEMENIARIIKSQGQINLFQSLCEILKIQQVPHVKQEQIIPRQNVIGSQQLQQQPQIMKPSVENLLARPGIFMPPSNPMAAPGPGPERTHRTSRTANVLREPASGPAMPSYIPPTSHPQNPVNPAGPTIYEPRGVPSGPIVAVDLMDQNKSTGVTPMPGPFVHSPHTPSVPGPVPGPIPGQMAPSGGFFAPEPTVKPPYVGPSTCPPPYGAPSEAPRQPDRAADVNINNPMNTRGGTVVAPPPPPAGGTTVPGAPTEGYVTVKVNTAPRKAPEKPKPIQMLPPNARDATCLTGIQLKTAESKKFMEFMRIYEQKDNFGFQRNAPKLGDFLIYLSDYVEVPGLFQQATLEVVRKMLEAFGMQQYDQGSQVISEHNKVNTDLSPWVSCIKIMAISLKK